MSFGNFLKFLNQRLYSEYVAEKYFNGEQRSTRDKLVIQKPIIKAISRDEIGLECINNLPKEHYVRQYVEGRKIDRLDLLYFAEDFKKWSLDKINTKYTNLTDDDVRVVIPFFDIEGNLVGAQGRSLLADKKLRYVTVRSNEDVPLIYGLERWEQRKTTYIVEGPLDSLFLPNAIAAASSDLVACALKLEEMYNCDLDNVVLVFDNEPRSREITKIISTAINSQMKVCLWPENIHEKDINEMIVSGKSKEQILGILRENTYNGLLANMAFNSWKRV